MEVIDNNTTTRDKMSLNELGVLKVQSISVSIIIKTGMEVEEDCIVFNHGSPRTQEEVKPKDRRKIFVLPGKNKVIFERQNPLNVFIMDNMDT